MDLAVTPSLQQKSLSPSVPLRVLIYSRDREIPDMLGKTLRSRGCSLKFCDLESSLWESLRTVPWDIVVHDADRSLPFSLEPYFRWNSLHPESRLWLLANEGGELPAEADALSRESFVRIFPKPVNDAEILQALQEPGLGSPSTEKNEAQILIADSDPTFCEDLLDFLSLEGYRARTARCADEALDELRRQFYNVALVDSRLPGLPVWELASRLHEAQPNLMVIVLADYASLETVLQVMRADVYDYLLKPLDAFAFRRTLARSLEKQRMALQIQSLMEGLQKANEDLLRLNELKSQFLRLVTHDLRTPLTSVKGYAQALQARVIPADKYPRCFDTMVRECEHLEHLISDLVDFISIETGKLRLEMVPCDPQKVFARAVDRFRLLMEEKKIRYRVTGLKRSWPNFNLDPRRMDQVLSNLVGNALKHTPERGRITVDFRLHGRKLSVSVTDTGAGLAPEHLSRVFDQFYQVDSPRARGGLGLGLSISREIVRRHGGDIAVSSLGLNKGSTFWFTVPVADGGRSAGTKGGNRSA